MTDFRQAGMPAEVYAVNVAIAGDAEIIHERLVGSKTGQNGDSEASDKQRQRQPANFQSASRKKDPECCGIPLWKFSANVTDGTADRTHSPLAMNWSHSLLC